jgi:hypothetical protein
MGVDRHRSLRGERHDGLVETEAVERLPAPTLDTLGRGA